MVRLGIVLFILGFGSCAGFGQKMSETNREYLNHPAMDLQSPLTPQPVALKSRLNTSDVQTSGGCSACAH